MIITDSSILMGSTRQFVQSGAKAQSLPMTNLGNDFLSNYEKYVSISGKSGVNNTTGNSMSGPTKMQMSILASLMQRMMGYGVFGGGFGTVPATRMTTYSEYESTSFSAKGSASTADGRTIDFSIDIMMSRSYMEYTDLKASPLESALTDPLVINVGNDITRISDQKFMFDLDCDGKEEEMSMLEKGSGFLALDLNEDGIINDGNELFGTKSGNGFADLREYDTDGNGWIDEADEVFSKLKVWCKGENGEDILMNLKEADVGAIFLGASDTQFSQMGMTGLNGVIRQTGFFLKESAGVGTVQHVDMVTTAPDSVTKPTMVVGTEQTEAAKKLSQPTDNETTVNINNDNDSKNQSDKREEIRRANDERRIKNARKKKEMYEQLMKKQREHRAQEKRQMDKQIEELQSSRLEHAKRFKEAYEPDFEYSTSDVVA